MIMFKAAMMISNQFPLPAPAIIKKNLPKKPAVGGMPANENNEIVSTQVNNGFVYKNLCNRPYFLCLLVYLLKRSHQMLRGLRKYK